MEQHAMLSYIPRNECRNLVQLEVLSGHEKPVLLSLFSGLKFVSTHLCSISEH